MVVRLAQYDLFMDKERRLGLAKTIISGKIRNQQAVILQFRRKDAIERARQVANEMDAALDVLDSANSIDEAMGCEGIAAKFYFELGFLHSIHYGRNSLVLDLMEEFRAPFVDAWIIRMFNRYILTGNDFEGKEQGYYLTRAGYHKFLEEFHKHAKEVEWRRRIAQQSSKLRAFILQREAYEPFESK